MTERKETEALQELDRTETQVENNADDAPMEDGTAFAKDAIKTRKGRGHQRRHRDPPSYQRRQRDEDSLKTTSSVSVSSSRALPSIEGWIVLITGLHEEATEEDVVDRFAEYGPIRQLHLNMDHRTGFVKGYALIEYAEYAEAKRAIDAMHGESMHDHRIQCDFAFVRPPAHSQRRR